MGFELIVVQVMKDKFPSTGVTLTSDGWSDVHNHPLLNMLAVSPAGEMFLTAIDTSGEAKTGVFIAEKLCEQIEEVGPDSVVQVILASS